jgi:hypothetical protein
VHPRNQDTAMAIHRGYMSVRGSTPEESRAIRQAAIYWQKVHDYGVINVPVGVDENWRGATFYGSGTWSGVLAMRRPKGGPVPLRPGDRSSRGPKYESDRFRRGVEYPGPYYPGVYPP